MRTKLIFLAGAGIGYVLGARDGRGRYEQLKSQADSLWNDPRVQEKVEAAGQAVKDKAPEVQAKLQEAAGNASAAANNATSAAKDKLASEKNSSDKGDSLIGAESTSDYTPKETKFNSAE